MKKLNKVAVLFASAALATAAAHAQQAPLANGTGANVQVQAADGGNAINNWQNGSGELVWVNGTNELCWRNAFWTPATAATGCDGALVVQAPAPAPAAPVPPPPAPEPEWVKTSFSADTFFDFDKATLKPEGRAQLDELAERVHSDNFDLEVIIAVGHTDSTGPEAYNQGLSERRAAAVKEYLVSKGIDANRIYTEGKGELEPIASNATREGRAQNRRVEIEVVGTAREQRVQ
ncbi:membrane protein [Lampropedia cohaerens]|uniref:Membrane protein n=1 Tax=Lampropedia cohaerens TaxID=1610491 RepID=A0A0U1PZI4_9BURK|nr:OmpA family protein [Lampropedia cohaerens]KKW67932.1 membrane protein [Lampropedia cohaerens]